MDEKALLEAIGQMMDTKLAQQKTGILGEVDGKLAGVEQRLDAKLTDIEQRISEDMDGKLAGVEQRLDGKLAGVEQRLDEKLAGVEQRLDTKLAGVEQRLDTKLAESERRIAKSTVALMDAEFIEKFNLLAENQDEILRRMPTEEEAELLDTRLAAIEAVVRKHGRDIAALKKAN